MEQDPGKARLDELAKRLDALNQEREDKRVRQVRSRSSSGSTALGMRVVTELLAGVFGGLALGWFLDNWLGTSPWLLFLMLALGMVTAFRNVVRLSGQKEDQKSKDGKG